MGRTYIEEARRPRSSRSPYRQSRTAGARRRTWTGNPPRVPWSVPAGSAKYEVESCRSMSGQGGRGIRAARQGIGSHYRVITSTRGQRGHQRVFLGNWCCSSRVAFRRRNSLNHQWYKLPELPDTHPPSPQDIKGLVLGLQSSSGPKSTRANNSSSLGNHCRISGEREYRCTRMRWML